MVVVTLSSAVTAFLCAQFIDLIGPNASTLWMIISVSVVAHFLLLPASLAVAIMDRSRGRVLFSCTYLALVVLVTLRFL